MPWILLGSETAATQAKEGRFDRRLQEIPKPPVSIPDRFGRSALPASLNSSFLKLTKGDRDESHHHREKTDIGRPGRVRRAV
jgi:hypothetical protein